MKLKNIFLLLFIYILVSISSQQPQQQQQQQNFIELFKPVQLIYPDSNHDRLIINESSINLLNSVLSEDRLSVLGVVGTFHSGKSFLLNQLLGTTDSFTVGPTVHPQTIGIWMWACRIKDDNGKQHNLLLLDTEGFYSSNVSETYDAKIFAITTLLSSHLIYNSVKIIDQSALEYLELLSRRTQLFALKSQIKSNEMNQEILGLNNILNFPSLTWVVQDFFQDIGDETPTQWLNNLLKAHSRDKGVDSSLISITDIFPSIECHTLFLPSGDRNILRHLNKAKSNDLNPIYIKELNELKSTLFKNDNDNGGGGGKSKLTGPSISTLLRLLIEVANGNKFPTVPSIWSGFIKQQQQSALEDSIIAYKDKMSSITNEDSFSKPPLCLKEFEKLESQSNNYATNLYKQLLFGLEEAYKPGQQKLERLLSDNHQYFLKENYFKIQNYCQRIYNEMIESFENQLESIKIPISSKHFNHQTSILKNEIINQYKEITKQYNLNRNQNQNNYFEIFLNSLEKDIERLINGKQLQNRNEIEILLTKSIDMISERYKSYMNQLDLPITLEQLKNEDKKHYNQLLNSKFKQITEVAHEESYYQPFKSMAEKQLHQLFQYFQEINEQKILEKSKFESDQSILDFKKSVSQIILPIEEESLVKSMNEFKIRSINSYKNRLEPFRNSNSYSTQLNKLESSLEKQIELKLNENVTQMKWIVMESLDTVRVMMISRTPIFWFQHSYENEAYREAEKRIIDKIKSKPLRDKVIKQFINNDLKQQLNSLFKLSTILLTLGIILIFSILISFSTIKK
ncbi:guanylate-binding protein [Dictyostelium discoideum AX4]|uniref:Guanylate-binding protein n=1 Tax=Dictyostelium discoideum TaxID=44689 RepID=Q54TN9_DICDI|nr:guanylate-binding protein [Dictyostelium discoideum AX4]EAL66581.1 guanylate-binding protein [Dictyostelium discoideum AX4]|eukprot:XP_640552.1 guanylate-binding protein [Dictyostelium discoideum AX4]